MRGPADYFSKTLIYRPDRAKFLTVSGESRISNLADHLWKLNLEELKHFGGVIEKIISAKEAIVDAEERSSEAGERQAAQIFRELRRYLEAEAIDLSGPECVILGSYYLHEDGHDTLESKRLNIFLESYGRKPANSTSIVDKLAARGLVRVEADGLHAHKKFRLTGAGREEALELVTRLRKQSRQDSSLAVVGG